MKREGRYHRFMKALRGWICVFMLAAFVITCCMMLFVSTLSISLGIDFTAEHLSQAAKLTFINVVFLSVLFTVIDQLRRWLFIQRPVKRIIAAAEKMTQGDFSVRVPPMRGSFADDNFNEIIDCFNKLASELSGTETLRTDFIANVSHELKTPLAIMQNYGTMLSQPQLDDEQRVEYARAITDASRRLASLITNILKLNKLENQTIFPAAKRYDLGEQLCECLLQFENEWERKNIDIVTDIAEDVTILADAELTSLVWNNLLSNAFKFTEPGGTVSVSMSADDTYATVRVSDTGCGIAPEVGEHIFEKFYQGDTSRATQGNGLGLALVKRVVDITGGEITVESALGRGSAFIVRLKRGE